MAVNLQTLLGRDNLTGVITDVAGGVPSDGLPPGLFGLTRPVVGNTASYFKVANTRRSARLTDYGSRARTRNKSGIEEVPVKLMHSLEMITHEPATLTNLMSPDEATQRLGEAEVGRQTGEFARLFQNLRVSSVASTLANGQIYFDRDGELSGSTQTGGRDIDFSVPAGNQTQVDALGDGDIIDASWSTAGTDIIGQMIGLQTAAVKLSGQSVRHAIYGADVPGYLAANTALKDLVANNASLNTAAAAGRAAPVLDLQWWNGAGLFFEDQNGTKTDWLLSDEIIFLPEPNRDWWEIIEGSLPISQNVGASASASEDLLGQVTLAQGLFSVAEISSGVPAGITQIAGDTFLPTLKNPNAIFIANVAF